MKCSTATEGQMSRAPSESDISASLQQHSAYRKEKSRFELPISGTPVAAGLPGPAFERQSRPRHAFCRPARTLSLEHSLAATHVVMVLRASEDEWAMAPSVTLF